jgi:OOP family OmpA-OmpF porin
MYSITQRIYIAFSKSRYKLFMLIATMLLSNACTRLETFQRVSPQTDLFTQSLLKHYQNFATDEAAQYDWTSSQHFIDKGMKLAYGKSISPELIEEWSIPDEALPALIAARHDLVQLLEQPAIRQQHPNILANAFFGFDCWVEQQEENWQTEEIEQCRDLFFTNINILKKAEPSKDKVQTPATPTNQPASSTNQKEENKSAKMQYRIFFTTNSSILSTESQQALKHIANDVKQIKDYEIILNGYTDRVGSEEYNLKLSQHRATTVKQALIKLGLKTKNITIYAFGESDPDIATPDEQQEPRNRRVEIFAGD